MKKIYNLRIGIVLALFFAVLSAAFGQAPGGVSTGLTAWYRGDLGLMGTTWADQTGNGYHLARAAAPAGSSLINFNPVASFGGVTGNHFNYTAAKPNWPVGNTSPTTYYYVAKNNAAIANRAVLGIGASGDATGFHSGQQPTTGAIATRGTTTFANNTGTATVPAPPDWDMTQPNQGLNLVRTGFDGGGTTGRNYIAAQGGTEVTNGTNVSPTYLNTAAFRIGASGANSVFWSGDIAEVIVFSGKHDAAEYTKVETYLALKYGISKEGDYVDADDNVVYSDATYNSNIAGIGRDDVSGLHQKQSMSQNAGLQVLIGNGSSLFETNAANTNNLNDGQYLVWGDNGLERRALTEPLSYIAGSNGNVNARFEAVWKVQNAGSTGTVTVAWPRALTNMYLVRSTDETFDASDDFFPMTTVTTIGGVDYNTATVTLSDGDYFTFAGFGQAPGGVANNLSYWYRADIDVESTGDGTDVTAWTDRWNGTTSTQLGANALPKYVEGSIDYFNFNPGINFTAGTQTLGNNTVRTLTSLEYDVFTLTKEGMASGGGNPRLFSIGMDNTTTGISNWDAFGIFPNNSNLERRVYGGGTYFPAVPPAFSTTIPSIMYFANTNTTSHKGLNGDALATNTVNYSAQGYQYGGHMFGDTRFSGNGSDNAGFIGHIGETIVYGAGSLTETERRRVDSYLAIKYGITLGRVETNHYLASDASVVWNGATNSGYNNHIFGIANDLLSGLHQKQSKSVNPGQQLIIGAGTGLFENNAENTNALEDGQFLMVGDNDLQRKLMIPLSYTAGSNGNVSARFEAVWKVQNTGSTGAVTVAWPGALTNMYLVQSADEMFDNTDTFTPMTGTATVNGVEYSTATVTLNDGEYFTFAGFQAAPGGVLTGLTAWYKGNNGLAATAWEDQTPSNYHLSRASAPAGSSLINFNPVASFGGVTGNHFNYTAAKPNWPVGNTSPTTYYYVAKSNAAIANRAVLGIGASGDATGFHSGQQPTTGAIATRGTTTFANNTGTAMVPAPPDWDMTQPNQGLNLVRTGFDGGGTTGRNYIAAQGGTEVTNGTNVSPTYLNTAAFRIGASGANSVFWSGDIAEVIVFSGKHDPAEYTKVETYLALKYGISKAGDYVGGSGNVVYSDATYSNNIAGIARDDLSLLHQKQSQSANSGHQVLIGTTGLADANADNTVELADGQYLVWGDNGLAKRLAEPLSYSGTNGVANIRYETAWKVQNTGAVGMVTVAWPLTLVNMYLVRSTDETFDGSDDFFPMTTVKTINGVDYNATTITFNDGDYFTFAGFLESCPTLDCNPNTFLNTADPNSIEYDNMVGTFHSTLMRQPGGTMLVWGENMASNGTAHVLAPLELNASNYPGLTGDILKFTGGSNSASYTTGSTGPQFAVLTTDGLFVWGVPDRLINSGLTSGTAFQQLAIGTFGVNDGATKADGLPSGVSPADVKMLFGSHQVLALATCSGEAWVLATGSGSNYRYGDGAPSSVTNNRLWHRVHTDASTTLDNVIALRGNNDVLMALTANGEVYTWGANTRLGDGTPTANRNYATRMTLPAGVTPKMIGATYSTASPYTTYYILGANGDLYSMGANTYRQLGNFTTTASTTWVQVQRSATPGDYLTDVVWISPNEHDSYGTAAINVLTADGRLWAWGNNASQMLGGSGSTIHPTEMPGGIAQTNAYNLDKLNWTDKVIAVETGGHTTMIVKENSNTYGYVGHRINGSMGDGTSSNAQEDEYNFRDTPEVELCGAEVEIPDPCISGDGAPILDTNSVLEFAAGDENPTDDDGPVQGTTIRFRNNTDNRTGNTFETYAPAVTVAFELTNHQYELSTLSTGYPVNIGYRNSPGAGGTAIFSPLSSFGAPSNSWFTSYGTTTGEGIDTDSNYGVILNTITSPLRTADAATSGEAHQMADLVVTFSEPVNSPILHIGGMGSRTSTNSLGFSQEYDLVEANVPITLTRLSGSDAFAVSGTNIHLQSTGQMDSTGSASSGSGSVRINGTGITTLTLRVFVRGDGSETSTTAWSDSDVSINSGDVATISFSVGAPIQLTNDCPETTVDISGIYTGTPPAGTSLVWHQGNNPLVTPQLADPTAVGASGTYYAFYYDSENGCYSPASTPVVVVMIADCLADIQVNKTGPVAAAAGNTISYAIHVTNNGPADATDVVVIDPAADHFTVTDITCVAGDGSSGSASCPASVTIAELQGTGLVIPFLPEGSGVTFTITGTVDGTYGEVITNTATAEYYFLDENDDPIVNGDPYLSNNSSTVLTEIYNCIGAETTYSIDYDATLAANTIDSHGGTINFVYTLTSGNPLPDIGTEFTLPVTYSALNNRFGVENEWETFGIEEYTDVPTTPGKFFVIAPKASEEEGGLYHDLPDANTATLLPLSPNNELDNVFTTNIADGTIVQLGPFTLTIGDYPVTPAGYAVKSSGFWVYTTGNKNTENESGFWLKPLAQTAISTGENTTNNIRVMPGDTYVYRYSAFSNGTSFASNDGAASDGRLRGLKFFPTNVITFMAECCVLPGDTGTPTEFTTVGVSDRIGVAPGWPGNIPNGFIAMESENSGFVITRVQQVADIQNPVEGMLVYEIEDQCIKLYNGTEWKCIERGCN